MVRINFAKKGEGGINGVSTRRATFSAVGLASVAALAPVSSYAGSPAAVSPYPQSAKS